MIAGVAFANVRCKGERPRRELGWAPTHTTKDMLAGLPHEVDVFLNKLDAEKSA